MESLGEGCRKQLLGICLWKSKAEKQTKKTKPKKTIVFGGLNPSVRDSSLNKLQQQHKFFGTEMVNHYPTNYYPTWMLFSPPTMEQTTCSGESAKKDCLFVCLFVVVFTTKKS